ncbi:TniQ family protein [Sutcliffiella horikoshii]|uniref:TniQ family protein n=1 Tax=Sutcliffiella horikoshii TaxID=79883 RepID=UPI003850226E
MKSGKLVFSFADLKKTKATWRSSWILDYESPWSVIQKFCHYNSISFRQFLLKVGNDNVRKLKGKIGQVHKSIYNLNGLDDNLVKQLISFPLKEKNGELLDDIINPFYNEDFSISNYFSAFLRLCPLCIEKKYHSTLHQFNLIKKCPFHQLSLFTNCPKCNENFPYILEDNSFSLDYRCKCGFEFSSNKINPLPSQTFKPILRAQDVISWLSLKKSEINKVRNSIIFNEHLVSRDDEEKSDKYDLSFLLHSLDQKYMIATLGENYDYLEKRLVRERRRKAKWIKSVQTYERIFTKKDLEDLHEKADKVCSSIARNLRNTTLKSHRGCIVELTRYREEILDNELCPLAIAYSLWRARLQRFHSYKDVDNEGTQPFFRKYIYKYGFPVSQYNFSNYLSLLEYGEIFPKNNSISSVSYSWITLHLVSELILAEFYRCLEYALHRKDPPEKNFSVNSIYSLKYFPLLIIRKENKAYKKIKKDIPELFSLLENVKKNCNCPQFTERERRKRKKARGIYYKSNPITESIDNI